MPLSCQAFRLHWTYWSDWNSWNSPLLGYDVAVACVLFGPRYPFASAFTTGPGHLWENRKKRTLLGNMGSAEHHLLPGEALRRYIKLDWEWD